LIDDGPVSELCVYLLQSFSQWADRGVLKPKASKLWSPT